MTLSKNSFLAFQKSQFSSQSPRQSLDNQITTSCSIHPNLRLQANTFIQTKSGSAHFTSLNKSQAAATSKETYTA